MKEMLAFLKDYPSVFLATVDAEGHPHVRAFRFMMEHEGLLYFGTSIAKAVYAQLKANPYVEFATSSPDFSKNMRVSGEVLFKDDPEIKMAIFQALPMLKEIYQSQDNPTFVIFCVQPKTAKYWSPSGAERTVTFT